MNLTKRLHQLNKRAEWLLDQAELIVKPYKLDRHAFAYENLWERYRSQSRKLKRIQLLVRQTEIEARQIISELLNR